MNSEIILVLDQSLRATGWAVIRLKDHKILDSGCIKTKSAPKGVLVSEADIQDGFKILETLITAINQYKVTTIVFENPVGSLSARSGIALAYVKGLVIGLAKGKNLKLDWVTAKQAKNALTKDRHALKEEVFKKVSKEFPSFGKKASKMKQYIKFAVSDALAVYLCWREIN